MSCVQLRRLSGCGSIVITAISKSLCTAGKHSAHESKWFQSSCLWRVLMPQNAQSKIKAVSRL